MSNWEAPRYDVGAGTHLPDPADPLRCLCGHTWDHEPAAAEWRRHRYGPPTRATTPRG